jgi:hypothetical protein
MIMKTVSSRWLIRIFVALLIPSSGYAQYNLNKKHIGHIISTRMPILIKPPAPQPKNPQIQDGTNARTSLANWGFPNNNIGSSFRTNAKLSMSSIESAIRYHRMAKQKIDLSFLTQLGYSLLNPGHWSVQTNDVGNPAIIK